MSLIYSLDSSYYTDPAIFAQERRAIFKSAWWLLGPERECMDRDQYLCDVVCGWPVFVIRGADGELRGFHNVCRHRGAALLTEGAGTCRTIRCPYHSWGYDQVGRLIATPGFGGGNDFDPDQFGLFEIRVHIWRGMVFVTLDPDAPKFEQWIGSLEELMRDFPGCDEMTYHGSFTVEGQANWKTYCDNTVEGYHLPAVHQRLAHAIASGSVDIRSYDNGELVAFHVDYGGDGASLRGNQGLWAYKFPGFQIAISANAFKIERVEATGIDSLRSLNWAWYRNLSDAEIKDSIEWSETVVKEDIGICEQVQKNLSLGIYVNGPLSPEQESNVAKFQSIVKARLSAG